MYIHYVSIQDIDRLLDVLNLVFNQVSLIDCNVGSPWHQRADMGLHVNRMRVVHYISHMRSLQYKNASIYFPISPSVISNIRDCALYMVPKFYKSCILLKKYTLSFRFVVTNQWPVEILTLLTHCHSVKRCHGSCASVPS